MCRGVPTKTRLESRIEVFTTISCMLGVHRYHTADDVEMVVGLVVRTLLF